MDFDVFTLLGFTAGAVTAVGFIPQLIRGYRTKKLFAEALEETRCVLLPVEPFMLALREDHQLSLQILSSMAMWVKSLVSLLEDIVLRDAIGRVAGYLLQAQSEQGTAVSLPSLKKHIASHLNLTSETLSRTLRQLRDERLIGETDAGLVIHNARGLQRIAEGFFPRI